MKKPVRQRNNDSTTAGMAVLEQAARNASTDEQRVQLEQAANELLRLEARRARLREKRKRSEQRLEQERAERAALVEASVPAAKVPFPLSIERTDEIVDLSNVGISWARVWKGTTAKGTRVALAVCSIAFDNDESQDAREDPGISGDLEEWLAMSFGGGPPPCETKDDFEAEDLKCL